MLTGHPLSFCTQVAGGMEQMRQRHLNARVDNRGGASADTIDLGGGSSSIRPIPTKWLILCGVLLIAAIAIATASIIDNFRERALKNSERELENAVLMLTTF